MRSTTRYEEQNPLTAEQRDALRAQLEEKRRRILQEGVEQMDAVKEDHSVRMSDEVDMASVEYDQAFEHRIRDRERMLLKKLDKVLKRIDDGEYDECETCGNHIGYKRLAARPEATLCIECKEEQERVEKQYKKRREVENQFPFK